MKRKLEAVIGLEIHAQMKTDTKIFCGCSTEFGSKPNTQTCPVCTGLPGVLPVLNKKALEFIIKAGLAMNCNIARNSRFARKNYFYPDLPKGYQISQYELPICEYGYVTIESETGEKRIGITRIHMEEDAGKNIHEGAHEYSFVDLNRTGVPLMEIVTEPEIATSGEAADFMRKLRSILRYLDVCDGNLEQGSLRCDANVSVRPEGSNQLGVKAEIKNINSFRFVERAIEYEIKRQIDLVESGGAVIQETRLWNSVTNTTESMRSKEEAHDYRYFPDPDLVPVMMADEEVERIRQSIPELPDEKRTRFISEYALSEQDADMIVAEKRTSQWFEEAVKLGGKPKVLCNWMTGEFTRLLNDKSIDIDDSKVKPHHLCDLLTLIDKGTISVKIAKTVFEEIFEIGRMAEEIIKDKGLIQISDSEEIEALIDEIISKNPDEVNRFKAGENKLMGFFVGQAMKATKGKANPKVVNEIIGKKLSSQA